MDVYVVMAYRYGNAQGYNFLVGVFTDVESAIRASKNHKTFRGGKYEHKVMRACVAIEYDAEGCELVYNSCKS